MSLKDVEDVRVKNNEIFQLEQYNKFESEVTLIKHLYEKFT